MTDERLNGAVNQEFAAKVLQERDKYKSNSTYGYLRIRNLCSTYGYFCLYKIRNTRISISPIVPKGTSV